MARQVLPIVGAIVGAYFGNPQLGYAIGSIIGNAVDPQRIKGPRLQEIPSQTASEGGYRQVVYGTSWINNTNVLDFGDVQRVIVDEQQGKGGGPIVETERLYRTYAIGLGEPLEAIRVIRKDGKIVYDVRPDSTIIEESQDFESRFRFYTGAEDQLPDPDLEALPQNGVGNTPYYRGTSYLVFPNDDLTDMQGRIPTYEVEGQKTIGNDYLSGASIITNYAIYNGPIELLTSTVGGRDVTDGVNQAFSVTSDGLYLAGGRETAPRFNWWKYDQDSAQYIKQTAPSGLPTSGAVRYTAWDETNTYLAVLSSVSGGSERLLVFKRSGDTLTKLPFIGTWNTVAGSASGLCITSVNGLRAAYTLPGGTLVMHNIINDIIFDGVESAVASGDNAETLQFSVNGSYVLHAATATLVVWDASSPGEPATIFDSVVSAASSGAVFSPNGAFVYSLDGVNSIVNVYSFNEAAIIGSALSLVDSISVPVGNGISEGAIVGVNYLALGLSSTPAGETVYVYAVNPDDESILTAIANQPTAGTATTVNTLAAPSRTGIVLYDDSAVVLSALVEDICDRCGLDSSKLDLSELTDQVKWVTLGGPYDGAGAITTLMPAYFFDVFEADRKVWMPKRGAAVSATITEDDLIEEPDENTLRGQDIEYPRSILLKYLDAEQNYAAPAATVQRNSPDIRVRGEATAELPISLSRTEAFRVADRMLKVMWEDLNGEVTFSLPAGPFAWLTPTDCLGLSLRGALYRIRVEKVEYSAGVLKITARRDRQSAYTSVLTPIALPTPTPPPAVSPGVTTFVVMNLPALTDETDLLGVTVAMTGAEGSAWSGAQVAYRVQGATEWISLGNVTTRAKFGYLLSDLPAASPFYTDTTNPLEVSLVYEADQLETISTELFLSEGNPVAVVYPDYTAEILQFRDAQDDGSGDWTLTTLQRGRLNTSSDLHSAGAVFVDLTGAVFLPLPSAVIGQTLEFRVTSLGTSPETAPTQTLVWNPSYSQYEFPVENLTLTREGGFITGAWSPRYRFGTDVAPVSSQNFQFWRVTLTDGTLTESFDIDEPAFSTFDSAYTGTITVSVAQLNRYTGAGPSVSESI
jgi:hypothetical protein